MRLNLLPPPVRGEIVLGLLLLILLALLGCGWAGYRHGAEVTAAVYGEKIANLKADDSMALAMAEQKARDQVQAETVRANGLAASLDAEKAAHAQLAAQLKMRTQHVTTEYRTALDQPAQPLPHAVFTIGFLREFNDAVGADELPPPFAAAAAAAPAGAADAFDALESGLTEADILDWVAGYGQQCQDNATQLNRLIDYVQGMPGDTAASGAP